MNEYFKRPVHQIIVTRPLEITEATTNYDIRCSVKGGGLSDRTGEIILGISKALIAHDESMKELKRQINHKRFKSCGTKKYGHRKARRSFQFSKR